MRWAAASRHPTLNRWLYYTAARGTDHWSTEFEDIMWFGSEQEARQAKHYYMVVYPTTEDEVRERCVQQALTGEPPKTF